MRIAMLAIVVACGSPTAPKRDDAAPKPSVVVDAAIPIIPIDACFAPESVKIENGHCDKDADCVLTDLAASCGACILERVYPTRKVAFDERTARCTGIAQVTMVCGLTCPVHDTYTGAFYRPECRAHRCIAWRYHSGG